MKTTNTIYWISTILFAGYMIFAAIPDARATESAVAFVHDMLGYPVYFLQFIGVAKLIGCVTILIPGMRRLKEWAYAGLMFDLIGATYSIMYVTADMKGFIFMAVTIAVGMVSYIFWHKKLKQQTAADILY